MGIKEKSGVESETWEESETKVKALREHIGSEKKKSGRKDHHSKIFKLQAEWESVKQIQGAEIWDDQIYIN